MGDYYVSAAGSDSGSGGLNDPWQTVTRVNAAFDAGLGIGSRVLFNRGDTFYGALRPPHTLDPHSPGWLKIGAYGDAAELQHLCGYKTLNISGGWTQADPDTWSLDYSASAYGTSYGGYDSAQFNTAEGNQNVGFLMVDGVIYGNKFPSLGELADQWDFYSDPTQDKLYVRSTANPTTLASDIRCTVELDAILQRSATEISDLKITGYGANGIYVSRGPYIDNTRCRLLRCTIGEIGGSYLTGYPTTVRYGGGVNLWTGSTNFYGEFNTIYDCFDVAWTIQGTENGPYAATFTDVTWRRNLTYRNGFTEEYFYIGDSPLGGFHNCLDEYNTNLFAGYGWGGEYRPTDETWRRTFQTFGPWGDDVTVNDLTLRRNIFYDGYSAYTREPIGYSLPGLTSDRNVIFLRPGTKISWEMSETIEQSAEWVARTGREIGSIWGVLPNWPKSSYVSDADVTAALNSLAYVARTGQFVGSTVFPINGPWIGTTANG